MIKAFLVMLFNKKIPLEIHKVTQGIFLKKL